MSALLFRMAGFFRSTTWQQATVVDRNMFKALLLVHFFLSAWFITRLDFTADETDYFGYAVRWAHGDTQRVKPTDDSKSPIVAPALLSNLIKPLVTLKNDPHGFFYLQLGRYCMYVYQIAGAFLLFCWMYRLWGSRHWLLPLTLYLFDPTVFSYGMIVGSDLACAVLVLGTCYTLWRYTTTHRFSYWIWVCVLTSLALVAKASMVWLPVLVVVLLGVAAWQQKSWHRPGFAWRTLLNGTVLLLSAWLLINAAYGFRQSFFSGQMMPMQSAAMQQWQQVWQAIPAVPFPYDYVSAFDLLQYHAELGGGGQEANTFVGVSVLDRFFVRGPVWYYYLVVFWFKLPLLTLLLLLWLVVLFIRFGKIRRWQTHLFVWLPPLFFGLLLSLTNPFQIGIRHALMLYPFVYLMAGAALLYWMKKNTWWWKWLLVLHCASLVMFWPNMIAYTNELLWPKKRVYHYLNDSSVSYQHATPYLKKFLAEHPDYQLPGNKPAPGKYAVPMEYLASQHNSNGYEWLFRNFEPSGHFMYNIALFNISAADIAKMEKASTK